MYRVRPGWTSLALFALLATGAAGLASSGCRTAPTTEPAVELEGKSDAEILYDAVLVEFQQRELAVDSASRRFMVVSSRFHAVTDGLRRRFTVRIVRLAGGATALRVTAEHQRRHGRGEQANWKKVETDAIRARAERAELKLGRSVEKRYRRWKEYRQRRE